jgi:anti-sigma factor RsiW
MRKKGKPTPIHRHDRAGCLRIFRRLSDYLDGELPKNLCRMIERHLKGCPSCCSFLNTFRKTIELCRKSASAPSLSQSRRNRILRWLKRQAGTAL